MDRAWINAPQTNDPFHEYNGMMVMVRSDARPNNDGKIPVYFVEGPDTCRFIDHKKVEKRNSHCDSLRYKSIANYQTIIPPEGYVVDPNSPDNEIRFVVGLVGYWADDDEVHEEVYAKTTYKTVYPTKELAIAAHALSKLLVKRKLIVGNWEPDYRTEEWKHIIDFNRGEIRTWTTRHVSTVLSFPEPLVRDEFMLKHADLIQKAKPLL